MFCLSELVSIIKKYASAQFTDLTIMNAVIFLVLLLIRYVGGMVYPASWVVTGTPPYVLTK
jgi:hypothetical protein